MAERLFKLTLEYDGSGYSGFQRQVQDGLPSLQGTVEEALGRLVDHPVQVLCAGRTDAGVHATGQVVSFRTTADRSARVVLRGANALLPPDIRVLEAAEAPPGFHPRFWARSRTYEYLLLPSDRPEALFRRRAWQVPPPLDLAAMAEAGRLLLGRHDFSTYCSQVPADESRVRTLLACQVEAWPGPGPGPWDRLAGVVVVRVRAEAFLRRMVRMITAALVKVGRGQWAPGEPARVLELRDSRECPAPAPPWGLYLVGVEYPPQPQDSPRAGENASHLQAPPVG